MQYINSLYSICIPFGIVNDLEMTSYIQEDASMFYVNIMPISTRAVNILELRSPQLILDHIPMNPKG